MYLLKRQQGQSVRIKAIYEQENLKQTFESGSKVRVEEIKPQLKISKSRDEANLQCRTFGSIQHINNDSRPEEKPFELPDITYIKNKINVQQRIDMKTKEFFRTKFKIPQSNYKFVYNKPNSTQKKQITIQKDDVNQKQFLRHFHLETVQQLKLKESSIKSKEGERDEYINENWLTLRHYHIPENQKDFLLRFQPVNLFQKTQSIFDEDANKHSQIIETHKKLNELKKSQSLNLFTRSIQAVQKKLNPQQPFSFQNQRKNSVV